jgi:hypothetical protein
VLLTTADRLRIENGKRCWPTQAAVIENWASQHPNSCAVDNCQDGELRSSYARICSDLIVCESDPLIHGMSVSRDRTALLPNRFDLSMESRYPHSVCRSFARRDSWCGALQRSGPLAPDYEMSDGGADAGGIQAPSSRGYAVSHPIYRFGGAVSGYHRHATSGSLQYLYGAEHRYTGLPVFA